MEKASVTGPKQNTGKKKHPHRTRQFVDGGAFFCVREMQLDKMAAIDSGTEAAILSE